MKIPYCGKHITKENAPLPINNPKPFKAETFFASSIRIMIDLHLMRI